MKNYNATNKLYEYSIVKLIISEKKIVQKINNFLNNKGFMLKKFNLYCILFVFIYPINFLKYIFNYYFFF